MVRSHPQASARFRPRLETLEARTLPATFTVTNLNDGGTGSLRAEIALANNGDVVNFAAALTGTIALASGELELHQSVTVTGPGAGRLTVSGSGSSRVFEVFAGANATISGLTVTQGRDANSSADAAGGGFYVRPSAALTLSACIVTGNSAAASNSRTAFGGGIANYGTLTLTDCTLANNVATAVSISGASRASGGAVYNEGTLTVSRCTFAANTASAASTPNGATATGGGIHDRGTLTLTDCTLSGNLASAAAGTAASTSGGGVYDAGNLTIRTSTLSRNTAAASGAASAAASGGGVWSNGTLSVTSSTLSGNAATSTDSLGFPSVVQGGGLYSVGVGGTLTNCTLADNYLFATNLTGTASPDQYGGGAYTEGVLTLVNCTLTTNSANRGGGLYASPAAVAQLRNTLVADNATPLLGPDVFGTVASLGTNLVGKADFSDGWLPSDLLGTTANPLNARLDTLRNNGGAMQTVAPLAGSPALAAGSTTAAPATDQRGLTRTGAVTIGAYQASAGTLTLVGPADPLTAGTAAGFTVALADTFGRPAFGYRGTVRFGSGDVLAGLPADYAFTASDNGSHTFGVTLRTAGSQTVTATDTLAPALTARVTVTVTQAGSATTLTASVGTSTYGQAVTFTAAVVSGGEPVTAGTVTFRNGSTVLATSTVDATGRASLTIATLAASGSAYTIAATYGGTTAIATSSGNATLTVTRAALTVTADNKSKVYGQANPALTATYSGFVLGEGPGVLSGALTLSTSATAGSGAGTYAITAGGVSASNYVVAFASGTLTIAPAPLTIAADNKAKVYGQANPTLTATYTGFVNGDTSASLTVPVRLTTAAMAGSGAGTYAIVVGEAASPNYAIAFVNGTLTIAPAALTITADNQTKVAGNSLPTLTATYTGLVNGDTAASVPVTLSTNSSNVAGTYAIVVGGAASPNYAIAFVTGTLTVTPAAASAFALTGLPATMAAGSPQNVTVTARDAYGNVATGFIGDVVLRSTDPSVPVLGDYTFTATDAGTYTFTGVSLYTAEAQTIVYVLVGAIAGSAVVTVVPAPPAQLVMVPVPDAAVTAGVPFPVFAIAFDAYGNVATGYLGTVHFTSTDGAATLPDDYTFTANDQGAALFTVTLATPGPVRLTVSDSLDGTLVAFLDLTVS